MKNVLEIVKKSYPTFYDLLQKANFLSKLNEFPSFTLFVPRESAFKKVDKELFKKIMENNDKLIEMISLHIIPSGTMNSADLLQLSSAKTLGGPISIKTRDKAILLNNTAKVTKVDIKGEKGIIHEIDMVLLPKES